VRIGHRPAVRLGADRDTSVQQREDMVTASSYPRQDDGSGRRPRVDAGRLWTGGLATALVAALVAVVGVARSAIRQGSGRPPPSRGG
jgi:hypothetical protein